MINGVDKTRTPPSVIAMSEYGLESGCSSQQILNDGHSLASLSRMQQPSSNGT
jgi:hypothetical protein